MSEGTELEQAQSEQPERPDQPQMTRWQRLAQPRLGRLGVRLLALAGVALLVVGLTGWWMTTRILDDDGFADVVAQSSQKQAVRDYIGEQASLRLAKSSNFVSAARPVVSQAISQAIDTPPVTAAIRQFAAGAHAQIFQINNARRVDLDASQASITVRTTLQSIDPTLAGKLPPSVLNSAASISQSGTIDAIAQSAPWVELLYIPIGLLGILLLALATLWSRDRTHALRFIGLTMAVAGAVPVGLGFATPLFGAIGGSATDPGRGAAIAAFIQVLLGRLVGAGYGVILVGLLLALAPGQDGGDLRARAARIYGGLVGAYHDRRWRFVGALVLIAAAALMITQPVRLLGGALFVLAVAFLYIGIVVALRAAGLLQQGMRAPRLRKRQIGGVAIAMVAILVATTGITAGVVAVTIPSNRANPSANGCNGFVELCSERINQIVWPASHNAMNSAAYNFYSAEHTMTVTDQLNSGVKVLLLDVYYGYPDHGIVRTNLAGGIDRSDLNADIGPQGVDELNRIGALTGTIDTSGKKQDLYFCHDYCELGAIKALNVLKEVKAYLERNLTDVLMLDLEDYVQPKDIETVLKQAGLFDMLYTPPDAGPLPTLLDMTNPPKGQNQNQHRLIVTSERHPDQEPWMMGTYEFMQETPFTFKSIGQFNCNPNRGDATNPMLLVNHWLRPNGPPDPVAAAQVNAAPVLIKRMQQCIAQRKTLPDILAVDFTNVGDLISTVNKFNSAIAQVTGTAAFWTTVIDDGKTDTSLNAEDRQEIAGFKRLPTITTAAADSLLGSEASRLEIPDDVKTFQEIQSLGSSTSPTPSPPAPVGGSSSGPAPSSPSAKPTPSSS